MGRTSLKGKWADIYQALAPELSAALEKAGARDAHVPCPVHGGRDGFRLYKDYADTGGGICNTCGAFPNGVMLLAWLKGVSFKEAFKMAAQFVEKRDLAGVPVRQAALPRPAMSADEVRRNRERILELWNGTRPAAGSLVETYLRARGVWSDAIDPRGLRMHPGLPYWREAEGGRLVKVGVFPAMVATVTGIDGKILTLHRTYLSPDGRSKAPVPAAKKLMRPVVENVAGAAIQLMPVRGDTLGVAEGIETALAAYKGSGHPAWACVSAAMLAAFNPPPGIRRLLIWADRDASGAGELHAKKLQDRMAARGVEARIFLPDMPIPQGAKGVDWCDALNGNKAFGFPPAAMNKAAA